MDRAISSIAWRTGPKASEHPSPKESGMTDRSRVQRVPPPVKGVLEPSWVSEERPVPIRVLLADDHLMFRDGLISFLQRHRNIRVVGGAGTGEEAIAKALEVKPDVVVLDLSMPGGGGIETARRLREQQPEVKLLILTVSDSAADLVESVKAGASGYILKVAAPDELVRALEDIAAGGAHISAIMTPKLIDELKTAWSQIHPPAPVDRLTSREIQVLGLIGAGTPNSEIARALAITPNTVKMHVHHILDKLQLSNRTEAAAYAVRAGLVGAGTGHSSRDTG